MSTIRGNKRGISPLIATVLLFAFAVALSTMVISYVLEATRSTPCDDVSIRADGAQQACYTAGNINYILVNSGQTPIASLKVRLTAPNRDLQEVQQAIALAPGSAAKISIPYQTINPNSVSMAIVPVINEGGEIYCVEREIKLPLRPC